MWQGPGCRTVAGVPALSNREDVTMGLFKSFMPKKKKQMEVEPMAHAEEAEKES